jgi:hypothetical protein
MALFFMPIIDDDMPSVPDPWLDELASAQARRALVLALDEQSNLEPVRPMPVVIHG